MEENYGNIIAQVEYNITNIEEDKAFTLFQKRYVYKMDIIKTILFFALGCLFIYQIVRNPMYTVGWICMGLSFSFCAMIWINAYRIKKKLLIALKDLEDCKYIIKFYDDCFSVELIQDDENVNEENNSENEEPAEKIPPRFLKYIEDKVEVTETDDLFAIFLKKQTIYALPKRCVDSENIEKIRNLLSEKIKDGYKRTNK